MPAALISTRWSPRNSISNSSHFAPAIPVSALARLPVSLRVPVVLRYYADLSERDIALAIGRRPGTVKSRLHEARRRLAADPVLCALAGTGDAPRTAETAP